MKKKLIVRLLALTAILFTGAANAQSGDTLKKINDLIRKMTLEEKVQMIHASSSFTSGGVKRLNIPELVTSDGPHGVRPEHGRDWNLDYDKLDSGTWRTSGPGS